MARALLLTAAAFGTAVMAGSAGAQPSPSAPADRYGPAAASSGEPTGQAPRMALSRRVLWWPGKIERAALAVAVPVQPKAVAPAADYRRRPYPVPAAYVGPPIRSRAGGAPSPPAAVWSPPPRTVASVDTQRRWPAIGAPSASSLAGAPTQEWRPVFANRATPPTPSYPGAVAVENAAPPNRALAADRRYSYDPTQDHAVRFYSVARPFGLKPDPAPIPPQFFTASADLSGGDPPGPLPVNHTTAANRAAAVGGSDLGAQ